MKGRSDAVGGGGGRRRRRGKTRPQPPSQQEEHKQTVSLCVFVCSCPTGLEVTARDGRHAQHDFPETSLRPTVSAHAGPDPLFHVHSKA
ncbi:unnamed protein product [Caenorhabditis auriculariae]|uniref:Uncharacterized protein n=1 Tax=Caenorhabditis auriculariae TaxID=2777116 RepID=A0A8S1GRB8_9PELO|nr:unnamed protein product [Caenorhabditis auriculariae]